MTDEQIKMLRNYSCQYCKRHFSRSINCRYHEIHCKPKNPNDLTYIDAFQFDAGTEKNGDFEEIEQGFNHTLVTYRKQLVHESNMNNLEIAVKDAITILQKEVAVRYGMKWYFALKLTFRKAVDEDVVTDPPVVINTNSTMGLIGNNYDHDLNEAFQDIVEQIESFESDGSGWVVDKFQVLDLKIATSAPWFS